MLISLNYPRTYRGGFFLLANYILNKISHKDLDKTHYEL